MKAYVCQLCGFVSLSEKDMMHHLSYSGGKEYGPDDWCRFQVVKYEEDNGNSG